MESKLIFKTIQVSSVLLLVFLLEFGSVLTKTPND